MAHSKVNIRTFREHLLALLPMRNESRKRGTLVESYCVSVLTDLGRQVKPDLDGNIMHFAGNRAIVAHTDSVMQGGGKDIEPIVHKYGRIHSKNRARPIGGDDKVGIAIALTIAAAHPELAILLFADEEVGCVGSRSLKLTSPFDLAVQCDRKGVNDLVGETSWTQIASAGAQRAVQDILPHRDLTVGGLTDVVELVCNGQCDNAFNLSCGYYEPHSRHEYIVLAHAVQALLDAEAILLQFPQSMAPAKADDWGVDDTFDADEEWTLPHSRPRADNWEEWEAIEQCEAGPFGDNPQEWVEGINGDFVNNRTGETVLAECINLYYAACANSVLNVTKPAGSTSTTRKGANSTKRRSAKSKPADKSTTAADDYNAANNAILKGL